MKTALAALAAGLVLVLSGPSASAHHSFTADFDWKQPVTLTGMVTEVRWTAPHVRLYLEVEEPDGDKARWRIELGSPMELELFGWTPTIVGRADMITVDGWRARDGSRFVNAKSVTLMDGDELFGASSFFRLPGTGSLDFDSWETR